MNTHQALARALELRDLAGDSPAWSMIRSPFAPVIAAVLKAAFPRQDESVPGPELLVMLEPLLDDLHLEGFALLQAAPGYLNDWVKAGYLVRRSPHGTRDEIYELSTAAITALTYLDQIRNPRRSVTRSRLSTITELISQLAIDSDPDEAVVIERLEREAAAITERIGRIRERGWTSSVTPKLWSASPTPSTWWRMSLVISPGSAAISRPSTGICGRGSCWMISRQVTYWTTCSGVSI